MKLLVKKGKTSKRVFIFIQDSSSTTGGGLTGLTSGSSSLVCYRAREDDGNAGATQLSLTGGTKGTWSSGGFVEKDATNQPGIYELGLDNAGLASGSEQVVYMLKGATNMAPLLLEIQLVDFDPQDGVHLGLTCLPNTAVTTNASLLTSGTSTDQLSVSSGVASANATKWAGQATLLDANNLPKVDVEDIKGTVSAGTAGYIGPDWSHVNAPTTTVVLSGTTIGTLTTYTSNTPQTGDSYAIVNDSTFGNAKLVRSTTPANTLDVSSTGEAGLDFNNIKDAGSAHTLTNITVPLTGTLTTYTGNTPQTGDAFALLGTPANSTIAGDLAEIEGEVDTLVANAPSIRKNVALAGFEFVLYDSTDHVTPKTGRTVTAQRSIDGAALSSCTNSVTELSNGIYVIDLSAADLNGTTITLRFSATGADDCLITIITQP